MGFEEESDVLIVPVQYAQKIRCELEKLKLWDATYKLKKLEDSGQVAVPICSNRGNISAITNIWPDFQIARLHMPISKKVKVEQRSPAIVLQSEIKCLLKQSGMVERLLEEVPSKWERHGDLVIVPSHSFSSQQWNLLGSNLWQLVTKCLACKRLARHSAIKNDGFRSSKVVMLLGDNSQVTHTDNGIKYSYDVTKCMFSAGNITEKMRVASLDCRNETVVDLYAGIGYFTLPYLVHAKACHVHACEWNPHALAALRNNLLINGVSERCTVHEGDNRLLQLSPVADRVNLGLIPSSEEGWPVAVQVLKSQGGILHIHGNVTTIPQKIPSAAARDVNHDVCMQGDRNTPATDNSSGHFSPFYESQEVQNVLICRGNNEHLPGYCHDVERKTAENVVLSSNDNLCIKSRDGSQLVCSLVGSQVVPSGSTDIEIKNRNTFTLEHHALQLAHRHQVQSNSLNKSQQQYTFEDQEKEYLNKEASTLLGRGQATDMVSVSNNFTSLSGVRDNFNREEFVPFGKEHTTLACDEWSLGVQRKIKSLLEATKGGVWVVRQLHVELVKSYAPHVVHVVLDLECRPFLEESVKC